MLSNYLKISLRNLLKHKGFTLINIVGLGIGMAVFLLIALYVKFERSYEDFIPDAQNIYRVNIERYLNNELQIASAENVPGVGPALIEEIPEVTSYARLYNLGYKNNVIITNKAASPAPIAFKHRRFMYADSSFLSLMNYAMIAGDPVTALAQPFKAVISEEYAKLYFNDSDPMGKTLVMQDDDHNNQIVEITGIFKTLPANTHLKFDILFSYKTLYSQYEQALARYHQSWSRNDMYTFIKVKEGTDPQALLAKFPAIVDKYNPELKNQNRRDVLTLQPIRDIHLTSDLAEEPELNGDARVVSFLGMIGLFVLIIAWINYVNLSTARAMERAREVGVRKVTGALRGQLVGQFLIESLCVNLIALLLASGFSLLALPLFNKITGLVFDSNYFIQPWFLQMLPVLWLIGTLTSGIYPAWILSSFQPVVVLRGAFKNTSRGALLRKGLVVFQFMASVLLLAGTMIIYRQVNFMLSKDIGMNIDQVLVVERPGISAENDSLSNSAVDVFRAELRKEPSILAMSTSLTVPGKQREYKGGLKRLGAPDTELVSMRVNSMDYDFIDVFKMQMVAGRKFGKEFPSDADTSVIVTESGARLLGFEKPEDAINQTVTIPQFEFTPIIVGVVNDYHQVSLKEQLDPTIFYCSVYEGEFYSMRINTGDLQRTINHVEKSWTTAFPGNPFQYFFLDDYFSQQYANEQRFGRLAAAFAILAIIVGCLGLFGLSGYMIIQRTKEIGIRKVLGASVTGVIGLLSRDILKLVLFAIVIATPIAWWAMTQWLQDFPYRTNIGWQVFASAGLIAIVVAFLTVSFQSVKAALVNPVASLRSE